MDVLVVDDNSANSALYERVLRRIPLAQCHCFNDPVQALEWSRSNVPALLIVDYAMPSLNGVAFVQRFRQIPRCDDIPVIMLTGMNSARVRDEAVEAGVSVFLPKPINKDRFLAEVKRLTTKNGRGATA